MGGWCGGLSKQSPRGKGENEKEWDRKPVKVEKANLFLLLENNVAGWSAGTQQGLFQGTETHISLRGTFFFFQAIMWLPSNPFALSLHCGNCPALSAVLLRVLELLVVPRSCFRHTAFCSPSCDFRSQPLSLHFHIHLKWLLILKGDQNWNIDGNLWKMPPDFSLSSPHGSQYLKTKKNLFPLCFF